MPNPPDAHRPDDLDPLELAAADWLVKRDRGLSPDQQREFAAWLVADARHAATFGRLEETWGALEDVPAARVPRPPHRGRNRWVRYALPAAAAACLAFAFFVVSDRQTVNSVERTEITAVGELKNFTLPDGSTLRLNTASAVAIAYTTHERRVTLTRGEAIFEVAKNPERPFVVAAQGAEVRALGTAFNVRHFADRLEVLVTEGRVRVQPPTASPAASAAPLSSALQPVEVGAGQCATVVVPPRGTTGIGARLDVTPVATDELARRLAWTNRRVEFDAEPLATIVAELNRYTNQRLVIADPALARERFGGKFPADDHEAFIRILETNFGIMAERQDGATVLRRSPAPP